MSNRKISECINIRINVGNYQHIELTQYAEEEIEYANASERIEKEDQLREELVTRLRRSMKAIPEQLGKGIEAAIEVEESIQKALPEWLGKCPVPNIANGARKAQIKNVAEQKAQKDEEEENLAEVTSSKSELVEDDDLFENDEMPEPNKTGVAETSQKEEKVEKPSEEKAQKEVPSLDSEINGIYDGDDDDLFDNM